MGSKGPDLDLDLATPNNPYVARVSASYSQSLPAVEQLGPKGCHFRC